MINVAVHLDGGYFNCKSCPLQQFIQNLSVAIAHTYSCQLKWCVQKLTTAIVHTKVVDCISANINEQL